MGSLIIIAAMFALLWLLLIRPQRAAHAKRERMVQEVDVGDEILSSGGVYGTVRGVGDDDELYVEIAPGVEVRMDRRAVGAIVNADETAGEHEHEDTQPAEPVEPEERFLDESAEPAPSAQGATDRDHG